MIIYKKSILVTLTSTSVYLFKVYFITIFFRWNRFSAVPFLKLVFTLLLSLCVFAVSFAFRALRFIRKQYLPAFPSNSRCIYISQSCISAGQQAESYSWLSRCPIGAALVAAARTSGPQDTLHPASALWSPPVQRTQATHRLSFAPNQPCLEPT